MNPIVNLPPFDLPILLTFKTEINIKFQTISRKFLDLPFHMNISVLVQHLPCSCSQLQNWALCKPSFEPNSINSQKSENLQWEKWRYITDIEKMFSDTAQYFHSKHLKNGPNRHEKHFFFNKMVFQGRKDIFQNWLRAAPLCQLNQTYRFIKLDQKG